MLADSRGKSEALMIKISPADAAFSQCVKVRVAGRCEASGREFPGADLTGKAAGLECAHVYGRRAKSTRWFPDNAVSLSHGKHRYYTENPHEWIAFVAEKLGQERFERLRAKWLTNVKVNEALEKQIAAHYRKQLRLMQDMRKQGVGGRIEFLSWDHEGRETHPFVDTGWRVALGEDVELGWGEK
jgi:hypothetical protein